jgi:RNA polymerase sigma-70 factor (ECF subfamily)
VKLDEAFEELRPALFSLAYRITGSRADAEEIVQDAFVRLMDAAPGAAVRSLQAYLATITARLSLNRLRDSQARRESYVGEWLPEPLLTENQPGVRAEDISFALLVVLERLSPVERVVFVLRTAFDLDFEEIGAAVQHNASACRKIFSRAKARVLEAKPRFAVNRERHRAMMRSFLEAIRNADMNRLVSLLDEKVVLHSDGGGKALASKKPVIGSVPVARFLIAVTKAQPPGTAIEEIDLNGQPAFAVRGPEPGRLVAAIMMNTDGERIHAIYGVANPDKLAAIGALISAS